MTGAILITGSNRGIGLELARQTMEAGWRVYATCRDPENAFNLNRLAATCTGNITVHPLDVTNPLQIRSLADYLRNTPIDILFNNAGTDGQRGAQFGQTDECRWLETFRVKTIAPLKVTEALADSVATSRRKVVATLSSRMGSIADNTQGASYVYRSSKAALNAVMKSAAIDLKPRQVTVIVLHPGWVKTDMGGPNAQISVEESVAGIRQVLERVTLADTGGFLNYDGTIIPW
jgi:NAD(P)-dependent dehydrogenase (short-subunit alcohol dehydrogenase family)